jgi:hypothetical protein
MLNTSFSKFNVRQPVLGMKAFLCFILIWETDILCYGLLMFIVEVVVLSSCQGLHFRADSNQRSSSTKPPFPSSLGTGQPCEISCTEISAPWDGDAVFDNLEWYNSKTMLQSSTSMTGYMNL